MTVVFTFKTSESKMEEGFQTLIHLNVFVLLSFLYSLHKGQLGNISGSRRQTFFFTKIYIFHSVPSVLSKIPNLSFNLN